ESVELRVVSAGHPGCARSVIERISFPRFRIRLAGFRHGPESPDFLAGRLIVCGHETAHAFVTSSGACNYQIADYERRGGAVVVLMPVGHLGLPDECAGETVQRDDVGVIGQHEDAVARPCDSAIKANGSVARKSLCARALEMPDHASAACVE